jgi:glycosyltransferase involved in cell wall biosynthesis
LLRSGYDDDLTSEHDGKKTERPGGMKIAMVVPCYLPVPEGGAERQCRLQSRELVRRGHAVTVYTRRWSWRVPRRECMEGVQVVRMGRFYPFVEWVWSIRRRLSGRGKGEYLGGPTIDQVRMKQAVPPQRRVRLMAVLEWIGKAVHVLEWRLHFGRKKNRPDLWHVHADTWEGTLGAVSGARWARPVFVKPTGFPLRVGFSHVPFAGPGQRSAFGAIRYFALSPEIHEALRTSGVAEPLIVDLPNGVVMPMGGALTERKPIVLMVGNLTQGHYYKAFDVMLEAWSLIARNFPAVRLQIAGAGDAAPWRTMAEKLGCAASVKFLGRVEDVGALYDQAQVFCLPSREEGISNALLEAQSHGVACVVSDIPANRLVVRDGENGRVVPVGDAPALASAVCGLLGDDNQREQFGLMAVRRIATEFEIGAVVSRLEAAYAAALRAAP